MNSENPEAPQYVTFSSHISREQVTEIPNITKYQLSDPWGCIFMCVYVCVCAHVHACKLKIQEIPSLDLC
jgi:hypothetical protein